MQEHGQTRHSSLSLTADADDGNSVYRISLCIGLCSIKRVYRNETYWYGSGFNSPTFIARGMHYQRTRAGRMNGNRDRSISGQTNFLLRTTIMRFLCLVGTLRGRNVSEAFEWTYVRTGSAAPSFDAGRPHNFPIGTFPVLEFLILSLLQHREMYGGEIAHVLATRMDSGPPPGTGMIYPLLKNMRRDGILASYHAHSGGRVYFGLTERGEVRLAAATRLWAGICAAIQSIAITAPEDRRYLAQGGA